MEHLRLDRPFPYSPNGIKVLTFPPGEYRVGQGDMTHEAARDAVAGGYGLKVRERYAKKVIRERVVK